MNEHPDELLAEYVDGTLAAEDAARAEAHLADCERCRKEVVLAGDARAALGTLPEQSAPAGLDFGVRRRVQSPSRRVWAIAGAAAVAAGVLVAAVLYFGPPQEQAATGGGGEVGEPSVERTDELKGPNADAGAQTAFAQVPQVRTTDEDYTPASLAALGRRLRDQARTALAADFPETARSYFGRNELSTFPGAVRTAVGCALQEVPPRQLLVPFRIERASFEGEPAYVTAFLQGPSHRTPYDRVLIWVVDRRTCSLRYYASQRL
jgi:hypothetical protein